MKMKKTMPEINVLPVYTATLPVLGQEIEYSPFNVQQEKALITALESDDSDDVVRNYEKILRSCVATEIDWDGLSVVDYIMMVVNIRSKSKGETVNLRKQACKKCSNPFDFAVDVSESLVVVNDDKKKEVLQVAPGLSLEISPLKYRFLYGLAGVKDEMDLYMHTAAHAVSKVIWNGDIFKPGPDELKAKVLKNLTKGNLEDLFKAYGRLVTVQLEIKYVCPSCGQEDTQVVKDFLKSLT